MDGGDARESCVATRTCRPVPAWIGRPAHRRPGFFL